MTTENNLLPLNDFKNLVKTAPLFAIDLVVVNPSQEILVGERLNAPAQGFWFVPGGRVYKNESLEEAFKRISTEEIGTEISNHQAQLLGLFEHFYSDSFFDTTVSTHYINATHVVALDKEIVALPNLQHGQYRWLSFEQLANDETVHQYSKIFLSELTAWFNSKK